MKCPKPPFQLPSAHAKLFPAVIHRAGVQEPDAEGALAEESAHGAAPEGSLLRPPCVRAV